MSNTDPQLIIRWFGEYAKVSRHSTRPKFVQFLEQIGNEIKKDFDADEYEEYAGEPAKVQYICENCG